MLQVRELCDLTAAPSPAPSASKRQRTSDSFGRLVAATDAVMGADPSSGGTGPSNSGGAAPSNSGGAAPSNSESGGDSAGPSNADGAGPNSPSMDLLLAALESADAPVMAAATTLYYMHNAAVHAANEARADPNATPATMQRAATTAACSVMRSGYMDIDGMFEVSSTSRDLRNFIERW